MPPFRFSLQKVLDYRIRREDEARLALVQAENAAAQTHRRLEELGAELESAQDRMRHETRSAADFWLWQPYLRRLTETMAAARRLLDEQNASIASWRQELQRRSLERKLMEKLRHRQETRHAHAQLCRDQQALDETATLAYCRRDL